MLRIIKHQKIMHPHLIQKPQMESPKELEAVGAEIQFKF